VVVYSFTLVNKTRRVRGRGRKERGKAPMNSMRPPLRRFLSFPSILSKTKWRREGGGKGKGEGGKKEFIGCWTFLHLTHSSIYFLKGTRRGGGGGGKKRGGGRRPVVSSLHSPACCPLPSFLPLHPERVIEGRRRGKGRGEEKAPRFRAVLGVIREYHLPY